MSQTHTNLLTHGILGIKDRDPLISAALYGDLLGYVGDIERYLWG